MDLAFTTQVYLMPCMIFPGKLKALFTHTDLVYIKIAFPCGVCMCLLCLCVLSLVSPASHSPKLIGVNASVNGCLLKPFDELAL